MRILTRIAFVPCMFVGMLTGCLLVAYVLDGNYSRSVEWLGYGMAFAVMIILGRTGYILEKREWRS